MDTETDSGSQSAPDMLEFGGSEITVPTIDGSHAGFGSSDFKASSDYKAKAIDNNILTKVYPPPVNTEANEVMAQANIQDTLKKASTLDKPIRSDDGTKDKTPKRMLRTSDVDSESDEPDESDEPEKSDESSREESKHQGSNLVQGLMDYLGVLEKRMGKLEVNAGLYSAPKQEELNTDPKPIEGDETTILGVRFFNSGNPNKRYYQPAHAQTERDAYMCDRGPKYLIRVQYSCVNENMDQPSDHLVSESPLASDIDIITFGVQSKPITAFFKKVLKTDLGTSHLIRFEKPFKAVIRNFRHIKEQLLKLETNFVSVMENVQQFQPNTPGANANQEEGGPLPFSPNQEDNTEAFDRAAALPHFQNFVAFLDQYLGKEIKLFNQLREGKEEYVAFEDLWMLFDSRDTIYCPLREIVQNEKLENMDGPDHQLVRRHTPQAYRVTATNGGSPLARPPTSENETKIVNPSIAPTTEYLTGLPILSELITSLPPISRRIRDSYAELQVYCFYIDFDGLTYGIVDEVFIFKPYEGEVDIRSLQAYPIEFATDHTLLDRGEKFLQLTRVSHKQYEGLTTGPNREEINSPVIVDVKLAFEGDQNLEIKVPELRSRSNLWLNPTRLNYCIYDVLRQPSCSNPWCHDGRCNGNFYPSLQRHMQYTIKSEAKLILEEYENPNQGGSAERKRFRHLMEIKDVGQDSEWKNLFLPPGHQVMVQAMVETHTSDKEGRKGMDLIRGKECVAAHTKRPLYPITCGDIGYNAEDVERNMETHFKLAHRWGCVLLLDEADVLLAKRDRNGLVSVFLLILEYYSGILFLTTNRVGAIDDAFRSRLHLTLYYPKLTKDQINHIFTHNFARIADINVDRKKKGLPEFEYTDTEDKILKWARKNYKTLRWNGRQIRNAFQTVLALSEFQARGKKKKSKNHDKQANPVVKLRYFKVVANAATQFNEYLKATHGYDEERVAKRDFIRAVEFSPKPNLLLTETEDSSDQNSDESDSSESDSDQSRNKENQDHSGDSDSDHEKDKKKKSKSKSKKESSKSATKKSKKTKDDKVKSERKSKDKKKEKKEKEDTDDSK
ncbi:hypothetical protein CHU98_g3163 [Xylaria longipes]|nr:hypothetical protein CHU98_g3163 [Xylaria longipes]